MRIGILTFHRAYNCGAALQAWALRKVLTRMGHTVEFPACNHVGETPRWVERWTNPEKHGLAAVRAVVGRTVKNLMSVPSQDLMRHRYRVFRRKFLCERMCGPEELARHFDLLVVGSDQVFSSVHTLKEAPLFFCENKPADLRAIAYAASYGDQPLEGARLTRVVDSLARFACVSVRERLAQEQLQPHTLKPIAEVLDPTLLVSADDYDEIAEGPIPKEPYLFLYTLKADSFFLETARALARRLGVRCMVAPCYLYSRLGAPKGMTLGISPERLVQYARHARYVLAASFHGTVMGAVFRKPFLSLRGQVDASESRPAALLRKLDLLDRLVNPTVSLDDMEAKLRAPLPDCQTQLEQARAASLAWLRKAVEG